MNRRAGLGPAEANGMAGRHPVWNLFSAGQKLRPTQRAAPRPKASTGARAVMAGFGPYGVAVTDWTAAGATPGGLLRQRSERGLRPWREGVLLAKNPDGHTPRPPR